jgi:putative two-component system response regulator
MSDRVLVVDDEPAVRGLLLAYVSCLTHDCLAAANAAEALALASASPHPALVLSDIEMPGMSGVDLLKRLKALDPNIQVVMISGVQHMETVRECLREGAYDYLVKPFEMEDLLNTVERALERARLIRQNQEYRDHLERMVREQTAEIRRTRDIALLTLAKLAECRDHATGQHLERMAAYSRRLAEELVSEAGPESVPDDFVDHLFRSSPLHDIGKVGIPDTVLLKAGPLDPEEKAIMRTHPQIGGDTLRKVVETFHGRTFLSMGMEIAYSHHERWDGTGYPNRLKETDIPLAARIVAVADAYDAITSLRPYKAPLPHDEAVRRITAARATHFDPALVDCFLHCHQDFAQIRRSLAAGLEAQPSSPWPVRLGAA